MRIKKSILLFALITILSGCNDKSDVGNSEDGISTEHKKDFIEGYETYEERVNQYDGNFIDQNGELIEFNDGIFPQSDLLELAWEDRKRSEDGEEVVLSEKESQLITDFLSLYELKKFDYFTEDIKQKMIEENPEYANPLQASINLEEKIIDTLELDKEAVTTNLLSDVESSANFEQNAENGVTSNSEGTMEPDQETASAVQQYIVNVVNDLTVVENVSTELQSTYVNTSVYGESHVANAPLSNDSIELMKNALDDLTAQEAPLNTEYFVLEPQLKKLVNNYQTVIAELENNQDDSEQVSSLMRELQILDGDIKEHEASIGTSIAVNNYMEYNALVQVWKEGENFQFTEASRVKISSGIKTELIRNGLDFEQDISS